MLILVDPHNGVPVYRQVMDQIRDYVASGLLAPGAQLPSIRGLAISLAGYLSAERGSEPVELAEILPDGV